MYGLLLFERSRALRTTQFFFHRQNTHDERPDAGAQSLVRRIAVVRRDVLQRHPAGLRAEEIRVHIQARRPIGDTLQGMLKGGVLTAQGRGAQRRYVVSPAYAAQHGGA